VTAHDRAVRIGITGPIACGKSTVAGWLDERDDVVVVDADRLAREVLAVGTPEVEAVYRRFGETLRRADGALDRAALGRIVFADPATLRDLEAIVHPAVRPRILAAIADADGADAAAVVVEAIKLVEGGLAELCDEVWLVTCDMTEQRARLLARGEGLADATARITAQGDLAERLRPHATRVIDTSGSIDATRATALEALGRALAAIATADDRPDR
jgi:dephospho-CoA kinase